MKLKTRKNTVDKYLALIQDLSRKTTAYSNLNIIALDYNVGKQYIGALKEKNFIILDGNGYYNWNRQFSPSLEIVNSILKDVSIQNRNYMLMRKDRQSKKQIQIQFSNKPFTDKPKVKKSRRKLQEPEPKIEQIGLIRKFIKFIW